MNDEMRQSNKRLLVTAEDKIRKIADTAEKTVAVISQN